MTKPIGPDLFRHLTGVGDPTLMPDGSRCAYVLSWIDEETSQGRSRIYQVRLNERCQTTGTRTIHPRQLRHSPSLLSQTARTSPSFASTTPPKNSARSGSCPPTVGRPPS